MVEFKPLFGKDNLLNRIQLELQRLFKLLNDRIKGLEERGGSGEGSEGPIGPRGLQGRQGRYRIWVYRAVAHEAERPPIPSDGSRLVAPTDWSFDLPGTELQDPENYDVYESFAVFDPLDNSLTPWSIPIRLDTDIGPPGPVSDFSRACYFTGRYATINAFFNHIETEFEDDFCLFDLSRNPISDMPSGVPNDSIGLIYGFHHILNHGTPQAVNIGEVYVIPEKGDNYYVRRKNFDTDTFEAWRVVSRGGGQQILPKTTDPNTLTTTGVYIVNLDISQTGRNRNWPTDSGLGLISLRVINSSPDLVQQFWGRLGRDSYWRQRHRNGNWSAWSLETHYPQPDGFNADRLRQLAFSKFTRIADGVEFQVGDPAVYYETGTPPGNFRFVVCIKAHTSSGSTRPFGSGNASDYWLDLMEAIEDSAGTTKETYESYIQLIGRTTNLNTFRPRQTSLNGGLRIGFRASSSFTGAGRPTGSGGFFRIISSNYMGVSGSYNGGFVQVFEELTTGKVYRRFKQSDDLNPPTDLSDVAWVLISPEETGGGSDIDENAVINVTRRLPASSVENRMYYNREEYSEDSRQNETITVPGNEILSIERTAFSVNLRADFDRLSNDGDGVWFQVNSSAITAQKFITSANRFTFTKIHFAGMTFLPGRYARNPYSAGRAENTTYIVFWKEGATPSPLTVTEMNAILATVEGGNMLPVNFEKSDGSFIYAMMGVTRKRGAYIGTVRGYDYLGDFSTGGNGDGGGSSRNDRTITLLETRSVWHYFDTSTQIGSLAPRETQLNNFIYYKDLSANGSNRNKILTQMDKTLIPTGRSITHIVIQRSSGNTAVEELPVRSIDGGSTISFLTNSVLSSPFTGGKINFKFDNGSYMW